MALCEACDRVLLASDATLERIAIPWLHVVREHPAFLKSYQPLFDANDGCVKSIWQYCRRTLRAAAEFARQLGRAMRTRQTSWAASTALPPRADFLFISHLLNPGQAGQQADFYYGSVPSDLRRGGHSVVIALIDHTRGVAADLALKWQSDSVPRVILSRALNVVEELRLYRRLRAETRKLRLRARSQSAGLDKRVLMAAAAAAPAAAVNLRLGQQIEALVAALQPGTIVVTYEGHAFERIVFAAARAANPRIRCIGYQHAALFRLQHAIRRDLAPPYDPDAIMTAGAVGKSQLEGSVHIPSAQLSILGSNRAFNPGQSAPARVRADAVACLVLPEGIAEECLNLFAFSVACARALPNVRFVWRLHPLLTFDSLARRYPFLKGLPANVILSRQSLEADLRECQWALYRGSTAIVAAVCAGLRPAYLRREGEMTIDPLYQLGNDRCEVASVAEFGELLTQAGQGDAASLAAQSRVQGYCRNFFAPFDHRALLTHADEVRPERRLPRLQSMRVEQ